MGEHQLDQVELAKFTGTEHWHRHALNSEVLFTDGARYVAERASAYWLLDEIALAQLSDKRVAAEDFQVWRLKVAMDLSAELVCEDGNNNVTYSKRISYTDFPAEAITLWFVNSTILLPSEY